MVVRDDPRARRRARPRSAAAEAAVAAPGQHQHERDHRPHACSAAIRRPEENVIILDDYANTSSAGSIIAFHKRSRRSGAGRRRADLLVRRRLFGRHGVRPQALNGRFTRAGTAASGRRACAGPARDAPATSRTASASRANTSSRLVVELELGVQRPVRIEQRLATDRDQIGLALFENGLGLVGMHDQPDRHGPDLDFAADGLGERHLEAVAARNSAPPSRSRAGRRTSSR